MTTAATLATTMTWKKICLLEDIPVLGSRVVEQAGKDRIAVFRNADDDVFALHDRCPHKGGPLSQGIVAGKLVTCPLHSWTLSLESGEAMAPDKGCARRREVKVESGAVWLLT